MIANAWNRSKIQVSNILRIRPCGIDFVQLYGVRISPKKKVIDPVNTTNMKRYTAKSFLRHADHRQCFHFA